VNLVEKICKATGKSEEEIWELVEKKRKELDYLISEEGALHIIASELGVDLSERLKVKDLKKNMRGVEIVLKVLRVFEGREWEKGGRRGKVKNILAGDETGNVFVSFWDEKADIELKEGDIIRISGGYVRERKAGGVEIRVGRKANVEVNPSTFPRELEEVESAEEKKLCDAKEGDLVRVRAALLRVFDRSVFYEAPEGKQLIVSGVIDDGSASVRAVFFRRAAEKLLGVNRESAIEVAEIAGEEALLKRIPLGKEFWITGRVKRNEVFETLEIIANSVQEVNPAEEVERKLEKFMGM